MTVRASIFMFILGLLLSGCAGGPHIADMPSWMVVRPTAFRPAEDHRNMMHGWPSAPRRPRGLKPIARTRVRTPNRTYR